MNEDEGAGGFDLRTAKIDDIKGRDLSPALIARAKAPKPTWFVLRLGDNYVFACEEREAWDIIYNRSSWKRHDFKFIGYSDGKTFQKIINESMAGAAKLEPEIARLKAEINKYRGLEEKLMLDEVVDMEGDPSDEANEANKKKVLRLRKIIDDLEDKLEDFERQHREYTSDVVKKATAEELKVAKKNWAKQKTWPRQVNIHTPGVNSTERRRILGAMGQGGII